MSILFVYCSFTRTRALSRQAHVNTIPIRIRVRAEDYALHPITCNSSSSTPSISVSVISDPVPDILDKSTVWHILNLPVRDYRIKCVTNLMYTMRFDTAIAIITVRYAWRNGCLRLQQPFSDAQDPHRLPVQCSGFSLSSKADPAPVKQTLKT